MCVSTYCLGVSYAAAAVGGDAGWLGSAQRNECAASAKSELWGHDVGVGGAAGNAALCLLLGSLLRAALEKSQARPPRALERR